MLLVDDNPSVLRALMRMLRSTFELQGVTDCVSAVAAVTAAFVAGEPFDAVITDLQMPDCDGVEAVRRIALIDARLARRAVICTGAALDGPETAAARAAGIVMLPKDASAAEIEAALWRQIATTP